MKKKYVLTIFNNGGETDFIETANSGYSNMELLGFLEFKKSEIIDRVKSKSNYSTNNKNND